MADNFRNVFGSYSTDVPDSKCTEIFYSYPTTSVDTGKCKILHCVEEGGRK